MIWTRLTWTRLNITWHCSFTSDYYVAISHHYVASRCCVTSNCGSARCSKSCNTASCLFVLFYYRLHRFVASHLSVVPHHVIIQWFSLLVKYSSSFLSDTLFLWKSTCGLKSLEKVKVQLKLLTPPSGHDSNYTNSRRMFTMCSSFTSERSFFLRFFFRSPRYCSE